MKKLHEGMRAGDLEDLILPLISVDEYESKIDDAAIAIGFYVHDEDAANDLNRFIQKSPMAILSSEVSPAPDQHGYFIVFIEMLNNDKTASNLENILKEIEPICNITKWKMRVRKIEQLIPFTINNFVKAMKIIDRTDETIIKEFFTKSDLQNVTISGNNIILESSRGISNYYEYVDFGDFELMNKKYQFNLNSIELFEVKKYKQMAVVLGEGWSVDKIGSYIIIQKETCPECIVLKDVNNRNI